VRTLLAAVLAMTCAPAAASVLVSACVPTAAHAQRTSGGTQQVRAEAQMLVDSAGITRVAVTLEPLPGWHIYGQESGDLGRPTTITWDGPLAGTPPSWIWPAGERLQDDDGLVSFIYRRGVVVHAPLTTEHLARAGRDLAMTVSWIACSDVCLPQSAQLRLRLRR
jgi:DsbC/DsbD-like thiol-disulfide interchange protein